MDVTAGSMTGVGANDLEITSMATVVTRRLLGVDAETSLAQRRLGSAVDITFKSTTTLEASGYSSATALVEGLEAEVTAAYADTATAAAFTMEAEAQGSATVGSSTVVVFEEPVVDSSSITELVVKTSAPSTATTLAPTIDIVPNGSDGDGSDDEGAAVVIGVVAAVTAVLVISAIVFYVFVYRKKELSAAEQHVGAGDVELETKNALHNEL